MDMTEQLAHEALQNPRSNRVFLGYVSAYRNTAIIAENIAEGIREAGDIDVHVCDIENMELGKIEKEIIEASSIILGCPTFSQNILLPVYQVFALINPIRDRGKLSAAFGSYGWSGEAAKIINANFAVLKLRPFDDGLMIKFTPHHDTLEKCRVYGRSFGTKLLEKE